MACSSSSTYGLQAAGGGAFYSTSTCTTRQLLTRVHHGRHLQRANIPVGSVRAGHPFSSTTRSQVVTSEECNEEDCAPEKEVGKVSMEWKAAETTKVLGTYPPTNKKKWTGYVEKDTAGQTNIYAVEPTVYVSENVISSNTAGDSSQGSEQTLLVTVGLALGLLFGAGVVLQGLSVSSSPSQQQAAQSALYAGPTLTYYIRKFAPQAAPPAERLQPAEVARETPPLDIIVSASQEQAIVSNPAEPASTD